MARVAVDRLQIQVVRKGAWLASPSYVSTAVFVELAEDAGLAVGDPSLFD